MIVVGQAPGPNTDPREPLSGMTGRRLDALCRAPHDRVNLLGRWPGRAGKGDAFPMALARPVARSMAPALRGRRVVLLGRQVAAAFDLRGAWFQWCDGGHFDYAVAPHPSGVNHWWNDPSNMRRARRFWRAIW